MIDNAGMEMFFVDEDAMTFERYRIGESWEPLMGSRPFANVVCVPKDLALNLCVFVFDPASKELNVPSSSLWRRSWRNGETCVPWFSRRRAP